MKQEVFESIEKSISPARLSTYQNHNANNNTQLITNYILNAKISKNFYFLLQTLEVSLRNTIYDGFKKNYSNRDFFIYKKQILEIDISVDKKIMIENVGKCYVGRSINYEMYLV